MKLPEATSAFIKVVSTPSSSKEEINAALAQCYDLLDESGDEDVAVFMKQLLTLHDLPDRKRASTGAMICGALVEAGFLSKPILEPYINLYEKYLDQSRPFFELFFAERKQLDSVSEEDNEEEKERELFDSLINDRDVTTLETHIAVAALNGFYLPAISIFSADKENIAIAKKRIGDKVAFVGKYSMGTDWMETLFKVVFDEPIVVIDIDRYIGFSGTINGLVDNYQLQHLLMGMPYMNDDKPAISASDLEVVNGQGNQNGEGTITNKWNMYNLELCKNPDWETIRNKPADSLNYRDCWIWSEGIPTDISKHNGYRVVLLGIPSHSRIGRVQRIFKNLKADIRIEKELSLDEINHWLHLLN